VQDIAAITGPLLEKWLAEGITALLVESCEDDAAIVAVERAAARAAIHIPENYSIALLGDPRSVGRQSVTGPGSRYLAKTWAGPRSGCCSICWTATDIRARCISAAPRSLATLWPSHAHGRRHEHGELAVLRHSSSFF
jgi:hypothetical protein